jgi:hypothetical protein
MMEIRLVVVGAVHCLGIFRFNWTFHLVFVCDEHVLRRCVRRNGLGILRPPRSIRRVAQAPIVTLNGSADILISIVLQFQTSHVELVHFHCSISSHLLWP